jgi:hypothetical protein
MCVLDGANTWSLIRAGYDSSTVSVQLGGTGRGRENVRSRSTGSVFAGRHSFLNIPIFLFYILYNEQWGFRCIKFQNIVNSVLDFDSLERHVCCSSVDISTTSSTH